LNVNCYTHALYPQLTPSVPSSLKSQRTIATSAEDKYSNMAEKKTDAPATNMLWGGRFTGSVVPGRKLQI
jgi:hypothetical protein